MSRSIVFAALLCFAVACGGDEGGSPVAPTPTTTSVSVTFPAGGTIFIGRSVQCEAREMLSNGTTRVATSATWGSDAPSVATVSSSGMVTAVAAGEAMIFADVNPRGTLRIRVFPEFGGNWLGIWTVTDCQTSAIGACDGVAFSVGGVTRNLVTFTQNGASVSGAVLFGNFRFELSGEITIDGELRVGASDLATTPDWFQDLRNWRSRADTPGEMTGTYQRRITFTPGGSTIVTGQLTLGRIP